MKMMIMMLKWRRAFIAPSAKTVMMIKSVSSNIILSLPLTSATPHEELSSSHDHHHHQHHVAVEVQRILLVLFVLIKEALMRRKGTRTSPDHAPSSIMSCHHQQNKSRRGQAEDTARRTDFKYLPPAPTSHSSSKMIIKRQEENAAQKSFVGMMMQAIM